MRCSLCSDWANRSLCPWEQCFDIFSHPAVALWEASSRFRSAGCSSSTMNQSNALASPAVCVPHFSPARALQLPRHLLRQKNCLQDQSLIREQVQSKHHVSKLCTPSAGDVGDEMTLVFNSMLLTYIFFSQSSFLRRQDLHNCPICFPVLSGTTAL